jgi:hypothetical protein
MVERSRIRFLSGALASIALPCLAGCVQRTAGAQPAPLPYGLSLCGASPDYYDYYYYPQDEVYFHIRSEVYFYSDGGVWWRVRWLPDYIFLDPAYRICLRIMDVQPWRYHYAVRGRYPPRPRPYGYYDYWYYPYWGIYFHIHTGWYYHYHDHRWRRTRRLPRHIRLDRRRRHRLHIPDRKPWHRHDEHRHRYPPPPDRREEDMPPRKEPPPGRQPRRPERFDQPERPTQPRRPERPEQPKRPDWPDRPKRPMERERPARPDRPEPTERPEQPERPERPERPDRREQPEQPGRPDQPERPERDDREPPGRGRRDDDKDKGPPIWWPPRRD